MKLADFSIKHPAVITICLIAIVFFGVIAVGGSNQEAFPPMSLPGASIITIYPGVGAEDIEKEITDPLEDVLSSLSGLSTLESSSLDSASVITVTLRDGEDSFAKLPEIREKINSVRDDLPEGISGEPEILIHDASSVLPVYSLMVKSSLDRETFTDFIENDFKSQITRIPGVSNVLIKGQYRKNLEIRLHIDELEPRGLSVLDIYQLLRYYNLSFPAGNVSFRDKDINIRTSGEFSDVYEIENLVVGSKGSSFIYLKDVADVGFADAQPDFYVRSAGEDVMALDIMKREEGNAIEIVDRIKAICEETGRRYPGRFSFHTITDQKERTNLTINTVAQSAVTGIVLAVLIIFLFLHNIRSTIIIGLSLPISILITFIGMYLTGTTINMLSLSGITVAIGMIVDSSIVVLENTTKHFRLSGDPAGAASVGADEVGGAVLASATTSICVFFPMIFLSGIIGIVMKGLSLSIVMALAASALVSVIIVPYLSAQILREHKPRFRAVAAFYRGIDRFLEFVTEKYRRLLSKALGKPAIVFIAAVAILAASVVLLGLVGVSFLPPTDTGELEVLITTPESYSLEETMVKTDEIDRLILDNTPEIESAIYYAGAASALEITSKKNASVGRIRLKRSEERDRTVHEIISDLQRLVSGEVTDADVIVVNGGFDALVGLATGGQGFKMRIFGDRMDDVMSVAQKANLMLFDDPDVIKTEMSMRYGREEIVSNLVLDFMGTLGITPYEAGITSRIFFNGMDAGTFRKDGKNYDIILSSDVAGEKIDQNTINQIIMKTAGGKTVSLASFTELETRPAVSSIKKQNRNISTTLTAYLSTPDQIGITGRISEQMNALSLPYGVSWEVAGTSSLISDSFKSLFIILGIAVFLVYMVMVIQFERFTQPVIIMLSIPFCLIGVVGGLILFGSTISIIPMLGMIALAGIVVNNAIVMVDHINMLRSRNGMALKEAVLKGCGSRLQPILMTTLTTFFGVIPMAFAEGNGAEIYAPLGQAIAGGLITSTLLTLLLVPVLYSIVETRREKRLKAGAAAEDQ